MQFVPTAHPVRNVPATIAGWTRLSQVSRDALYTAWTDEVLVDVEDSRLATAVPGLSFESVNGRRCLPLHVVVYFYGRLGWVQQRDDHVNRADLSFGISARALAAFEAWAVADGRLCFDATTPTGFLQRVSKLAGELAAGAAAGTPLPPELQVSYDSLVMYENHDLPGGAIDWETSWHVRIKMRALLDGQMLGPYSDLVHMLGPLLREIDRTDETERAMLVAEALSRWACVGAHQSFVTSHAHLPAIVTAALRNFTLPLELMAADMEFPGMLNDLDVRRSWAVPDQRVRVVSLRFASSLLHSLPTLQLVMEGEPEERMYDTACSLLAQQLPKQRTPTLAAFSALDRHIAAEDFDLSGATTAARIDGMAARAERDDTLERAAPYGVGGSSSAAGAGKSALENAPKPRCHLKAQVGVLKTFLNSADVTAPISWEIAPIAAAPGVAAVVGVPDETASGVAALIAHFDALNDPHEVLRVALSRRSVPLTQAVVFDVNTQHAMFNAISNARGQLRVYVSNKIVTLDDGSYEMEGDENFRVSADFCETLMTGDWEHINYHNDVLVPFETERCASSAPPTIRDANEQWFGAETREDVVTFADRSFALVGFDRNSEFSTNIKRALRVMRTTPAHKKAANELKQHVIKQADELIGAAAKRYRLWLGGASAAAFPAYTAETDRSSSLQSQAATARKFVMDVGAVMPSMLRGMDSGSSGAAAHDDDDDNDDGGGGGGARDGGGAAALSRRQQLDLQACEATQSRSSSRSTPAAAEPVCELIWVLIVAFKRLIRSPWCI